MRIHPMGSNLIKILSSIALAMVVAALGPAPNGEGKASKSHSAISSVWDFAKADGGKFRRASSGEREGNRDYIPLRAGEEAVIFGVKGPGVINHLWMTVLGADPSWPRMIVVEIYWDGMKNPSVCAPIGDFFGAPMGKRFEFQSRMLAVMPRQGTGFNSFWPMPFEKGAKIVVRNESSLPVQAFYYQVDYTKLESALSSTMRFSAAYAQAKPKEFRNGVQKFTVLKVKGNGCYAGHSIGVYNPTGGWFGEGDETITVDGTSFRGTGLEDAFGAAWRPVTSSAGAFIGFLTTEKARDNWKGFHAMYRFYAEPPICFDDSISVAFERRPQDAWSAVAYWYQSAPDNRVVDLPPPGRREPPRSWEGMKALAEARTLFAEIYKRAGWPEKFGSFDSVGNIIARVDYLFDKEDYRAALRLLRAAARKNEP